MNNNIHFFVKFTGTIDLFTNTKVIFLFKDTHEEGILYRRKKANPGVFVPTTAPKKGPAIPHA